MKMGKFLCRGFLGISFALALLAGVHACKNNAGEREIILLHTNDSHGSILPVDGMGGMAERATFIKMVRKNNPYVLLVDAGDINTGQAVSNMFDARPDIEAYNFMGYDAVTAGNHEFDKPLEVLKKQMQWAEFPFVISNVTFENQLIGKENLIKELNGVKIGLFGLTTKNTSNVSVCAKDLVFSDELETARREVRALKKSGAEVIIGLVHLGFSETTPDFITSYKLAEQVEGIDILVDGHSHSFIQEPVRINHTWIVTANQSGNFVGKGSMKVKQGKMTGFVWQPVPMKGIAPDSVLLRRLNVYLEVAKKDLETIVGKAEQNFVLFEGERNIARYEESALGNLVADALKWKAEQLHLHVNFGLTNSGGIRAGLSAGTITKGEVMSVLPFSNVLEIVEMKGEQVCRLFDFIATVPPGNGAFAQVSKEVRVEYDREAGRVKGLSIEGKPVEKSRIYRMATCDYVAAGKDGYSAGLKENNRENTSRLLSDVVMEYIAYRETITPGTDGRIRIVK